MSAHLVGLTDIRAAATRIAGRVRVTPVLEAAPLLEPFPVPDVRLLLKLESLQVTGSFKARGAVSKLGTLSAEELTAGLVTASGGNHGLAVAYAGRVAGTPATIFLPASTPEAKADRLRAWGATVRVEGAVWDEANEAALDFARERGATYVHPFADPAVIAGQGTLALELLEQVPEADTLVVAIGGGGLISGVATAAKALKPSIRIVGVEPIGAPTLSESLRRGRLVTLDRIETRAGTLAPRRSMPLAYEIVAATVDRIVLVSDVEMADAARRLWFECGVATELAGAAAVAALATGRHRPEPGETVVAIVCGAGTDGLS